MSTSLNSITNTTPVFPVFELPQLNFIDSKGSVKKVKRVAQEARAGLGYNKPPSRQFSLNVLNEAANGIYGTIRAIFGIFEMTRFALIGLYPQMSESGTTLGDSYAPYFFKGAKLVNFAKIPVQMVDTKDFLQDIFNSDLSSKERVHALGGVFRNLQAFVSDVAITNDFLRQLGLINPEQLPITKCLWLVTTLFNIPSILIKIIDIIDGKAIFDKLKVFEKSYRNDKKTDEYYLQAIDLLIGEGDDRKSRSKQYALKVFLGIPTDPVKDLKRIRATLTSESASKCEKTLERENLERFIKDSIQRYPKITISRITDIILMATEITFEAIGLAVAAPVAPFIAMGYFIVSYLRVYVEKLFLGAGLDFAAPDEWGMVKDFIKHYQQEYEVLKSGTPQQKAILLNRKIRRMEKLSKAQMQKRYRLPITLNENGKLRLMKHGEFDQCLKDLQNQLFEEGYQRDNAINVLESLCVYEAKLAMRSFAKVDNVRFLTKYRVKGNKVKQGAQAIDINFSKLNDPQEFLKATNKFVGSLKGRARLHMAGEALCIVAFAVAGVGLAVLVFSPAWPVGVTLVGVAFGLTTSVFIGKLYLKHNDIVSGRLLKNLNIHELDQKAQHLQKILDVLEKANEDGEETSDDQILQYLFQAMILREQIDELRHRHDKKLKRVSKKATTKNNRRRDFLASLNEKIQESDDRLAKLMSDLEEQAEARFSCRDPEDTHYVLWEKLQRSKTKREEIEEESSIEQSG